ncbi:MAG: hypothetical protein GEU26_12730 [Nitrososphaeraceae archaeon]|nr:hypothetical protein [Nitrososphaeraceae archaeon]
MSLQITKLTIFAIMIAAVGSLMVGSSVFAEQPVKAQNMTVNMTDPYLGNMSQTDDSGGRISSREPIACPIC